MSQKHRMRRGPDCVLVSVLALKLGCTRTQTAVKATGGGRERTAKSKRYDNFTKPKHTSSGDAKKKMGSLASEGAEQRSKEEP